MIVNKDGNMTCDGYTVNSNFFNNEIPISCRINSDDLFGGKSLPAGLLFLNTESVPPEEIQMGGLIDSSVFDKFIDKFGGDAGDDPVEPMEQEEQEEQEGQEDQDEQKDEPQENQEKQEDKEKRQTRKSKRNKTHNKRPINIKTRVKRKNTLRKRLKFIP